MSHDRAHFCDCPCQDEAEDKIEELHWDTLSKEGCDHDFRWGTSIETPDGSPTVELYKPGDGVEIDENHEISVKVDTTSGLTFVDGTLALDLSQVATKADIEEARLAWDDM